ncbi:hypothetical protein HXP44_08885 [Streptomyces sioyaensis]|uniref:Uncharacterized protein n=1 Tax=Streptomyces sioyaensis TaxID=67364 RepID=A0A4Q1QXP0_9ACTN|nr:hypothetical protein [Streptomyces sioyaensis]MBM4792164.1 hypothetical protein [Streptomyces sioyaensis]RXS64704.1 hypothetical protein EST54_21230 [Streptomyces sioyaensis]
MLRRLAVVLTGLLVTGFLAAGPAAATPADGHRHLTPKEREGLRMAEHVLDALFGAPVRRDRY